VSQAVVALLAALIGAGAAVLGQLASPVIQSWRAHLQWLRDTFSRGLNRPVDLRQRVERVAGVEPAWPAWKLGRGLRRFGASR
jgi:hypothetical protein